MAAAAAAPFAQAPPARPKTLDIYVVDTEGGKATLFVSPSGESLLIDAGNPGGRDTDRIMAVDRRGRLKQIDYVLLTHYHVDHIGGLQELAKRIPIKHFLDHGPSVEEREQVAGFQQAYAELYGKASHTVVKPGDKVPIAGSRLADRHVGRARRSRRRCRAAASRIRTAPISSRARTCAIRRTASRSGA